MELENGLNLGNNFVINGKELTEFNIANYKCFGLLFGASWCPPSKTFNFILNDFYNHVNKTEKIFEVLYISSDRDEQSFNDFCQIMPWVAISFEEGTVRGQLKRKFDIKYIPRLVIIKPDGTVLRENAVDDVIKGSEAFSDWFSE